MRALSLTRPWTWLVLYGGKGGDRTGRIGVENRSRPTTYRGPLVIHGALTKDTVAVEPFLDLIDPAAQRAWSDAHTISHPTYGAHLATGLLGVVDVVGCCSTWADGGLVHCDCPGWAMPGQHHWQITNPRPFRQPLFAKGALGLWRLTPDQQREVDLRLANMEARA